MFRNCIKFSVFGPHAPTTAPMGVKSVLEESNFADSCMPEKPQNDALSNLSTGASGAHVLIITG